MTTDVRIPEICLKAKISDFKNVSLLDGYDVLFETGGSKHIKDSIPFIYTIDKNGQFLKDMPSTHDLETLEKKRGGENWYRGYNRNVLLIELKKLLN